MINLSFYETTKIIDSLRESTCLHHEDVNKILELISEDKFAKYFFTGLQNPIWIEPLFKNGYFFSIPEPVPAPKGGYFIPQWLAGEYLAKFADKYEELIVQVIQRSNTENWRAQEVFIDCMLKMSPTKIIEIIPIIDNWLSCKFSDMLPIKLLTLSEYLLENKQVEPALKILEFIVTPILNSLPTELRKYQSVVRFRSDHYWVNEYINKQLFRLKELNPFEVTEIFERQLEKSISLAKQVDSENGEIQIGYYWRMDIPTRISGSDDSDALDILIDGLLTGVKEVCKINTEKGREFLTKYLLSEHIIFVRIALFVLREFGNNYPELINQAILRKDYLNNGEFSHEYCGILRDQYSIVNNDYRKVIEDWIISGPFDLESRAKFHAQWDNRGPDDNDRVLVKEQWILYHLELIKDHLEGESQKKLLELTNKYGKPDIVERPHIVTSSLGGAKSPLTSDEIDKKEFDELLEYFISYKPDDDFLNPRTELGREFEIAVKNNPEKYKSFAPFLNNSKLLSIYSYRFLSGILESIKNNNFHIGDEIIDLCLFIAKISKDPQEDSYLKHEPGLYAAQLEVIHLLEATLRDDEPYLSLNQLDSIRQIILLLTHHPDPTPEDEKDSSFDPFTHSLNCMRGEAMHCAFQYSLYFCRKRDNDKGKKSSTGFLEKEIQHLFEEKLDLEKEPSLAVHSVFGLFTPQLDYLSNDWLVSHLDNIFPTNPELHAYWDAAWSAYLFSSRPSERLFSMLLMNYQKATDILSQPKEEGKFLSGNPQEHLAQHILWAYLRDLTDFNHKNQLLDKYFMNASDSVRSNGVFWLNQVLKSNTPDAENKIWKKCWILWQKRIEFAETEDVEKNWNEISNYLRWLDNCPEDLSVLYPVLSKTIKYVQIGFGVKQIISFAAKYCEDSPLEAIILLKQVIYEAKEPWWSPDEVDERKVLTTALNNKDKKISQIAIDIINYHGENGDYRWRELIN